MENHDLEKTIIEAGVILITLLVLIVQVTSGQVTGGQQSLIVLGDLWPIAFLLTVSILIATIGMMTKPDLSRFHNSLFFTCRFLGSLCFMLGLYTIAKLFYDISEKVGTQAQLSNLVICLAVFGLFIFVLLYLPSRRKPSSSK